MLRDRLARMHCCTKSAEPIHSAITGSPGAATTPTAARAERDIA